MATATYDTEMIRNINMFESITDVNVRDAVIKEDEAHFVVPEGKAGMAIGKGGKVVKEVQEKLGCDIKIYEYSDNLGKFISNLIPADIRGVDIDDDEVEIDVPRDERGKVVGKDGDRIESVRRILERTHGIHEVKVN
jgi:N utilization substance protein A